LNNRDNGVNPGNRKNHGEQGGGEKILKRPKGGKLQRRLPFRQERNDKQAGGKKASPSGGGTIALLLFKRRGEVGGGKRQPKLEKNQKAKKRSEGGQKPSQMEAGGGVRVNLGAKGEIKKKKRGNVSEKRKERVKDPGVRTANGKVPRGNWPGRRLVSGSSFRKQMGLGTLGGEIK